VLVVEYGVEDLSWTPAAPYYANTLQFSNMLTFAAENIPGLNNRAADASVGAVVGGGSTVNGMAFERGSKPDYDAWEELGNPGWNWDELFKYFKKVSRRRAPHVSIVVMLTPPPQSTTYTPPDAEFGLPYKAQSTSFGAGPIQVGFPRWRWPNADLMREAWREVGVPELDGDGGGGDNVGLTWATSNIDQHNFTRSNARTDYYVPASSRPNLKLLARHYASRINFADGRATGLQIVSRDTNETTTVTARKEVVLATGALQTPKLLQLSGVGPADLLEELGIDVVADLPGVGANFQDHPWFNMGYEFRNESAVHFEQLADQDYFDAAWEEYLDNRTGPITHARSDDIVFLSLADLLEGDGGAAANATSPANTIKQMTKGIKCQDPLDYLPAEYAGQDTLLAGYRAQRDVLVDRFARADAAVAEFPFSGAPGGTVAIQKPLSRGLIRITAANVGADVDAMTTSPSIQFNTFANPIDASIAVLGLRKTRRFFEADALRVREPVELTPGANVTSDADLEAALRDMVFPSFSHPSGTASMLPLELGGVVDPALRVYGVAGLRVVDASVMPLIPACHLQATMYAVAEKAADLIKADQ
jgi:choline dehydrogenase-like flavoprotein